MVIQRVVMPSHSWKILGPNLWWKACNQSISLNRNNVVILTQTYCIMWFSSAAKLPWESCNSNSQSMLYQGCQGTFVRRSYRLSRFIKMSFFWHFFIQESATYQKRENKVSEHERGNVVNKDNEFKCDGVCTFLYYSQNIYLSTKVSTWFALLLMLEIMVIWFIRVGKFALLYNNAICFT